MNKFKIVFIGGASMNWIPKFIRDILLLQDMNGSEIRLMDIDGERLEVMGRLVERMVAEKEKDFSVKLYDDRRKAMKNADIVVSTCMVRGHECAKTSLSGLTGESPD